LVARKRILEGEISLLQGEAIKRARSGLDSALSRPQRLRYWDSIKEELWVLAPDVLGPWRRTAWGLYREGSASGKGVVLRADEMGFWSHILPNKSVPLDTNNEEQAMEVMDAQCSREML
jgi:hypothetical protein